MKLSVVIPCYNEITTIETILRRVRAVELDAAREIVVVDDGSTDGTREYLRGLAGQPGIEVALHERNRGKGAAVRTGFQRASGDILLVQDADLEYDPAEYPRLLAPILEGKADVVYGSRYLGKADHQAPYTSQVLVNRFLTGLSNLFTHLNLTDMAVCYKVFRREVLAQIELVEDGFGFDAEVTVKTARLGVRVAEVGISYQGRSFVEGKKIGWKDGVRLVYVILKYGASGGGQPAASRD